MNPFLMTMILPDQATKDYVELAGQYGKCSL